MIRGLLLGFLICYAIAGLLIFLEEEFDFNGLTYVFIKPWCVLAIILVFIPAGLWYVLKNVINPISYENWDKFKNICHTSKTYHIVGDLYMVYDTSAKVIYHKIYFVRIKSKDAQ